MTNLIQDCNDLPAPLTMGGKAAALAELSRQGMSIPAWFVITPAAFDLSLTDKQKSAVRSAADPAAIQHALAEIQFNTALMSQIEQAMAKISPAGELLAVRSSAVDEDGSDHSFAGQLESFLFVPADQVVGRVIDVWRSGFTDRVFKYRREHELERLPSAPAVLVQQMIHADVSGVAFAADPITGSRSTVVVSAVFGMGTALVGGDADCDTYRLDHSGNLLEQTIARKILRHVSDPSALQGVRAETIDDASVDKSSVNPEQLKKITKMVLSVSRCRGRPQDMEWAIQGEQLYLLQSRAITALQSLADCDGARAIWDNSNIAESYNGITTPLTFSFARHAYSGAYRQFCKLMKVPSRVIADNDAMFMQMLGLIRGRVYYNLINWYRLLAMLPGYSVNRKFMEQMMGVREGMPADIADSVVRRTWSQRQSDKLRLTWSGAGLVWNHFTLTRTIRAFYARLNEAMAPANPPLALMRLDQLADDFRRLEARLLTRWDAPLVNDFLAMIFFGLLGKLCTTWCPTATENLRNDLLGDEGGIISMEPAKRISEMARQILENDALVDEFCEADGDALETKLQHYPELEKAYREYLDKFGDRCLEELKLESATLTDDPTPLFRSIGHTAKRFRDKQSPSQPFRPREVAEGQISASLEKHPVRKLIFRWVLKHARGRVRDRENLRFERTRLFGRVRRIFVETGRRLVAEGRLDNARDIFYLTVDEILGFIDGTSVLENLNGLANLRRRQFDEYRQSPMPAERFETRGAVYVGNQFEPSMKSTSTIAKDTDQLKGIGCCPGIVRGPVRIIRDPRSAQLKHGEILVAERTDPGWIMLFPAAAGILVERGSLLSHSAIVAREMGIPAIVSVPGLTSTLVDGEWVEMNGSSGTIGRVPVPQLAI